MFSKDFANNYIPSSMEHIKTIKSGCSIIILSLSIFSVFLIPRYAYGKDSAFYDNNGDTGPTYGDTIVGG
jgi:hypothetical protein